MKNKPIQLEVGQVYLEECPGQTANRLEVIGFYPGFVRYSKAPGVSHLSRYKMPRNRFEACITAGAFKLIEFASPAPALNSPETVAALMAENKFWINEVQSLREKLRQLKALLVTI